MCIFHWWFCWFLIVLFSKCIFLHCQVFYFFLFYFEWLCVVVLIRGRIPRPTTRLLFQFSLDSFSTSWTLKHFFCAAFVLPDNVMMMTLDSLLNPPGKMRPKWVLVSFFFFFLEIVDVNFASFQGAFQYKVQNTVGEFCFFMLCFGKPCLTIRRLGDKILKRRVCMTEKNYPAPPGCSPFYCFYTWNHCKAIWLFSKMSFFFLQSILPVN